jgi:Glyoxalase-like domain
MVTGIDHLVIAVPELDEAARELERRVGLAVTGGGRHEGRGTANRIAFLADGSYLELMAVEDREAAAGTRLGSIVIEALDSPGHGLVAFALADDRLETNVAELQANGSSLGGVEPGSRRRDDGELVEWSTAFPASLDLDVVPFLIHHVPTGREWGPQAVADRQSFVHPIGSPVVLARLDIATPDPPGLAAIYLRELGLEFWAVVDLAVCTIGPHVIRLVPSREMDTRAVVTLGAGIEAPRSTSTFGVRFDVEPVEVKSAIAARTGPESGRTA